MISKRSTAPMRAVAVLLALGAGVGGLTGCVPLLIGGAMVGGSMVVTDRRTSGAQVDDEAIELKGMSRASELIGGRGSVSVTSYNRVVLLTGSTVNEADKSTIERAVRSIENVKTVVDELTVGFSASIGTRTNDTLLTSKVKASLVDAKDVQAQSFKVVTEKGVVYLMGRVTEREATRRRRHRAWCERRAEGGQGVRDRHRGRIERDSAEAGGLIRRPTPAA